MKRCAKCQTIYGGNVEDLSTTHPTRCKCGSASWESLPGKPKPVRDGFQVMPCGKRVIQLTAALEAIREKAYMNEELGLMVEMPKGEGDQYLYEFIDAALKGES